MNAGKITAMFGMGAAGLCLIGAGAGATFTDSVHSTQTITAGTMRVAIQPVGNDGTNVDDHNLTLNPIGPTASTFSSPPAAFKIVNMGNVTAHAYRISMTETDTNPNLANEIFVRVTSYDPTASTPPSTPDTIYDGPISGLMSNPITVTGDLGPNGTASDYDQGEVSFYTPAGTSLANGDQGTSITPTLTVDYQG